MTAADYEWGCDPSAFVFTEADQASLDFAATARADEVDFSEFYGDDDEG